MIESYERFHSALKTQLGVLQKTTDIFVTTE